MNRRPLPFEAMNKAAYYILEQAGHQLSLWGDEVEKVGVNKNNCHEILVLVRDDWDGDVIVYEDMLRDNCIFWEFRFDCLQDGWYVIVKTGDTLYTIFKNEEFGKDWGFEFMKGFSFERKRR